MPSSSVATFGRYALLGIYVGFIPVSLGLLWYPFLRRLGRGGRQAGLSLTVGLLIFLLFDTGAAALELIATTPGVFGGAPLVFLVALLAILVAALAGLPAVLGVWIGGFIYNALFAAIFLALGAGAIAQVVYEVGRLILRQSREEGAPLLSPATFGGLAAGIAIMYATALLVAA